MPEYSTRMNEVEGRLRRLEAPEPERGFEARLLEVPTLGGPSSTRRPAAWWARPWLATSTAGLALALGIALVVSTSRAVPAFTQVERALKEVRTVTWEETVTTYIPGEARGRGWTSSAWLRTEPPARADVKPDGSRTLMEPSGTRNYVAAADHYTRWSFPADPEFARNIILWQIVAPTVAGTAAPAERWEAERAIHEGRPVVRYTREYRWGGDELPAGFTAERYVRRNIDTVWVETESLRIVRREHRQFDTRDGRLETLTVAASFRYNDNPPPDVFSWKIPAGKQEEDISSRPLSAEALAACRKVIEGAGAAWSDRDFSRFASFWDFKYLDRFPMIQAAGPEIPPTSGERRKRWERQLTARDGQKNPWTSWKSETVSGLSVRSIPRLGSLPRDDPEMMRIDTRGSVDQADGSSWNVRGIYFLVQRDGTYRIVHWQHDLPPPVLWGN